MIRRLDAVGADDHAMALQGVRIAERTPAGAVHDVEMHPVQPGRYEADVTMPEPGAYAFMVGGRDRSTNADIRLSRGFYRSGERERAATGVNLAVLANIAASSGGSVLRPGESPFNAPRPIAKHDGRSAFTLAGLVLFLGYLLAGAGLTPAAARAWWTARHSHSEPRQEAA